MTDEKRIANRFEELRRKAEKLLQEQSVDSSQYPTQIPELIKELQIYHAELEIQNEELKRSQEELSNLYSEYEKLYEFAPCAYITLTPPYGIINRCNLTGATLLGIERIFLQYKSLPNFMTWKSRKAFFTALQDARESGEQRNEELELIREDGTSLWAWAHIRVETSQDGGNEEWQVVLTDITERKQAEEAIENERAHLSALLDNIGEAIVICDAEGRIVRFNETARRLHGLPEEPVPPEQWAEHYDLYYEDGITLLPMEDIPLFRALQGERVLNAEIVVAPKHSGGPYYMICSGQALTDEAGNITGAVIAMHDITERKKMEQLREDVDRITRHDLKTPLNGILGLPDVLLSDENLNEEQRELLEHIQSSGKRMLDTVNMSLHLYQMEKGEYELTPGPVELVQIIRDIKNDLRKYFESLNSQLYFSILSEEDNNGSFFVSGEKLLCYTMLTNLIKNAVESLQYGEDVHVYLEKTPSSQAKICVHNPGVIPEEIQNSFGQKYTTSGKKQGTGLGVYSACLIADTMNGSFDWSTSRESGTCVYLYLPRPEEG